MLLTSVGTLRHLVRDEGKALQRSYVNGERLVAYGVSNTAASSSKQEKVEDK